MAAAKTTKKSSPDTYTKPRVRDRLKAEILAGEKGGAAGQWSARKSQRLAAAYKKAGGGYKTSRRKPSQKGLESWTEEEWKTADGKPAIREGETARYLPTKAWKDLTPAQKKATDAKKRKGSKSGKQVVANTKAAASARKKATKAK